MSTFIDTIQSGVAEARAAMAQAAAELNRQRARIDALESTVADLLFALKAMRADHARTEPHHEHLCQLCRQSDAAIAQAERLS